MKRSTVLKLFLFLALLIFIWWIFSMAADDSMEVHGNHLGYPF
ncbi:MAG: hypothetical protein ABWY16_16835 [Pedobacter sp.]